MAKSAYYPQGVYVGRVTSQELGSSSKGTPQFVVRFQIVDCIDQFGHSLGAPEESYERSVYMYLTDNPKSIEITAKALKTLGYKGDKISGLKTADFVGTECELYCKHEEYEGETRERWSINTPREQRETKPVDPAALRKLDALFGKALKETKVQRPPSDDTAMAAASMTDSATEDEDIPF